VIAAEAVVKTMRACFEHGGKLLVCGNGGSAAQAQHFVAELVGRYRTDREPYAAISLCADTAVITAIANDFGYAHIFARQVQALGQPGDILVAISTSGMSSNVLKAIDAARLKGLIVIGISGAEGFGRPCDLEVRAPHTFTAPIQEWHLQVLHHICEAFE